LQDSIYLSISFSSSLQKEAIASLKSLLEIICIETFFETSKSLLLSFEANSLKQLEQDKIIIQHEETLEQLVKVWNILLKRIREYLYLKDPELVVYVGDDKALINILKSNSLSKDIPHDLVIALPKEDESEFNSLVNLADTVGKEIDNLKSLIENELNKLMPRTVKIATPLIAAKLLFIAGSFKNLAIEQLVDPTLNEFQRESLKWVINYIDSLDAGIKKLPKQKITDDYLKHNFKIKPENLNYLCLINKKWNSLSK
jgi:RNA processing factor Prp31